MKFTTFDLHPHVAAGVDAARYITPTPIQEQAIPLVMQGHDIVGLAHTGTGKTAGISAVEQNAAFAISTGYKAGDTMASWKFRALSRELRAKKPPPGGRPVNLLQVSDPGRQDAGKPPLNSRYHPLTTGPASP